MPGGTRTRPSGTRRRARQPVGRPVRRRPGRRAGRAVASRPTSTGGWRRTTSPAPGPTPGCCTRAGLLDDADAGRDARRPRRGCDADVAAGAFRPADGDEDVHTALERGLIERVGADLGGRLRAGRSRNDQVATLFRMYLRDHARVVAGLVARRRRRAGRRRPSRHLGVGDAGPHPPAARPAGAARPPPAGPRLAAAARRRAAARLGRPRGASRPTARARWPGSSLGLDPEAVAADLGFAGSVENSIDGTAAATSSPSSRSSPR